MPRVSNHGKHRIVERDTLSNSFADAKRTAKVAWRSGLTINHFQAYPKFFEYLVGKRGQACNNCSIRIYRGNIYVWRGKHHTLVTAHPIPDRFLEEMSEDKQ